MKKAKVSSVYEGGVRKRSSEKHSSKSARMAAKGRRDMFRAAKALSINPDSRTMVTRSMIVKTLADMHISEENLCEVEVVQAKEDVSAYIKPMEVVQEKVDVVKEKPLNEVDVMQPVIEVDAVKEKPMIEVAVVNNQPMDDVDVVKQKPTNEVTAVNDQPVNEEAAVTENQRDDGSLLSLNEWPMSLTSSDYEGVWPWFQIGYETGLSSYLDNLSGDFSGVPSRDNNRDQPVWDDDPWDFKDENETKKP